MLLRLNTCLQTVKIWSFTLKFTSINIVFYNKKNICQKLFLINTKHISKVWDIYSCIFFLINNPYYIIPNWLNFVTLKKNMNYRLLHFVTKRTIWRVSPFDIEQKIIKAIAFWKTLKQNDRRRESLVHLKFLRRIFSQFRVLGTTHNILSNRSYSFQVNTHLPWYDMHI